MIIGLSLDHIPSALRPGWGWRVESEVSPTVHPNIRIQP